MEHTPDSIPITEPTKKRRYKNSLLACFGFSGKVVEKKKNKVNSDEGVNNKWRSPWSWLGKNRKVGIYDKVSVCKRGYADVKLGRISQLQDKSVLKGKLKQAQDEIIEHGASMDGKPPKSGTCQPRLCANKKQEAKKNVVNLPRPLELGSDSIQKTNPQSKASSILLEKRKKEMVKEHEMVQADERKIRANSESLYGFSIIMVTLIIMLVWGKLCALFCTSVWLYFISRIKRIRSDSGDNSVGNGSTTESSNMNNEKYKKKVVLEGFLERNHRSTLRILHTTNKEVG